MSFELAMLGANLRALFGPNSYHLPRSQFSARLPLDGQRQRRRSPSAHRDRRALGKGASKLPRDIPFVCGCCLSCPCARPRNRAQRVGSWPLFFSPAGLPSTLRIWRSLTSFARLEHSVRWNSPSFARVGLALYVVPRMPIQSWGSLYSSRRGAPVPDASVRFSSLAIKKSFRRRTDSLPRLGHLTHDNVLTWGRPGQLVIQSC
jgi:hypothetical protein